MSFATSATEAAASGTSRGRLVVRVSYTRCRFRHAYSPMSLSTSSVRFQLRTAGPCCSPLPTVSPATRGSLPAAQSMVQRTSRTSSLTSGFVSSARRSASSRIATSCSSASSGGQSTDAWASTSAVDPVPPRDRQTHRADEQDGDPSLAAIRLAAAEGLDVAPLDGRVRHRLHQGRLDRPLALRSRPRFPALVLAIRRQVGIADVEWSLGTREQRLKDPRYALCRQGSAGGPGEQEARR